MPQWLVIGVSGVTCGGKTTLAHGLYDYFKGLRNAPLWNTPYTIGDVKIVSQDDYFLPVDDRRHLMVESLNVINFEVLGALDMKQMLVDIAQIINGPPTELIESYATFEHYAQQYQQQQQQQQQQYNPNYYQLHTNGKHMPAPGYQYQGQQRHQHHHQHHHHAHQHQHPLAHHQLQAKQQQQQQQHHHRQHLSQQQQQQADYHMRRNVQLVAQQQLRDKEINVLIIEGFLIFNQPELLALCNLKYHFHLPYEKCYERRLKRTYDPPDVTGYFELCVWPYYEKNFSEYRDSKDITFLNGETSKDKIFKFVLQRIVHYFEERCDVPTASPVACPPQQKRFGMLYMASAGGSSGASSSSSAGSNNNGHGNNCNHMAAPTACPMEQ
ncbi:hypothetical protein KR222_010545 [Zaprionus bogoriensis]|nr:hypothetical protein KR222_010545 [Zaprionus bogoriensis]